LTVEEVKEEDVSSVVWSWWCWPVCIYKGCTLQWCGGEQVHAAHRKRYGASYRIHDGPPDQWSLVGKVLPCVFASLLIVTPWAPS
jgi:hypothetical protein